MTVTSQTSTAWARICGWGDANGVYLLTASATFTGTRPDGSASATILPVLEQDPLLPAATMEPLSPLGGDSTVSLTLVIDPDYEATLGQLWKRPSTVARSLKYLSASETTVPLDDASGVSTGIRWIGQEAVTVDSISVDTLTVTRGALKSYARQHQAQNINGAGIGAAVCATFPGPKGMVLEIGRGATVLWRGFVEDVEVDTESTVTISAASLLSGLREKLFRPQEAVIIPRGSIIYRDGTVHGQTDISYVNRDGRPAGTPDATATGGAFAFATVSLEGSPPENPYAYVIGEGDEWIVIKASETVGVPYGLNGQLDFWTFGFADPSDVRACGSGQTIIAYDVPENTMRHANRVMQSAKRVQIAAAFVGNLDLETVVDDVLGVGAVATSAPFASGGLPVDYIDTIAPGSRGTGVVIPPNAGSAWILPPAIEPYPLLDWLRTQLQLLGCGVVTDGPVVRLVDWMARDVDLAIALRPLDDLNWRWRRAATNALPVLAVRTTVSQSTTIRERRGGFLGLGRRNTRTTITTNNDIAYFVSAAAGIEATMDRMQPIEGGWLFGGRELDWYAPRATGMVDTWGLPLGVVEFITIAEEDAAIVIGQLVTFSTGDGMRIPREDGTLSATSRPAMLVYERMPSLEDGSTMYRAVVLPDTATIARWEPSAKVVSYDAGTLVVTIEANEFTSASFAPTSDAAAFVAAGLVGNDLRLLDPNGAFLDTLGLTSITGNTFALFDVDVAPSPGDYIVGSSFPPTLTFWADSTSYPKRYS